MVSGLLSFDRFVVVRLWFFGFTVFRFVVGMRILVWRAFVRRIGMRNGCPIDVRIATRLALRSS